MVKVKQLGISLLEILIAIVLGMIVSIGMYELLISHLANYHYVEQLIQVQEKGRVLSELLQSDIRTAGYIGCAKLSSSFSLIQHQNNSAISFSMQNVLKGYSPHSLHDLPQLNSTDLDPDSDILMIKKMSVESSELISSIVNPFQLIVTTTIEFKPNDIAIIADCRHADIFKVEKVTPDRNKQYQILQTDHALRHYQWGANVGLLQSDVFYIANTHRVNFEGQAIYAMYLLDIYGQKYELADGVNKMKIRYGLFEEQKKTLHDELFNETLDWAKVRSIKISLLLSSIERVYSQPELYYFFDPMWQGIDRRLFRQWDVWVMIRER